MALGGNSYLGLALRQVQFVVWMQPQSAKCDKYGGIYTRGSRRLHTHCMPDVARRYRSSTQHSHKSSILAPFSPLFKVACSWQTPFTSARLPLAIGEGRKTLSAITVQLPCSLQSAV